MNHFLQRCVLYCIIVTGSIHADLTLRFMPSGVTRTIPAMASADGLKVAVPQFFNELGFLWEWSQTVRQLSCTTDSARYLFTQDNLFYQKNDELHQMGTAPVRVGPALYLPFELVFAVAEDSGFKTAQWDSSTQILMIDRSLYSVAAVTGQPKENAVVLTIECTDSVAFDFDYDYFHPKLSFTFPGATIDTARIRRFSKTGFVDSLDAVQIKESAQLTIFMHDEIQEPRIDHIRDLKTLVVTLESKPVVRDKRPAVANAVNSSIRTIVIDPGHGGRDPGAIGPGGTKEKDMVLAIALRVRDLLRRHNDICVFLTREKDVFIPLGERTRMANEHKADLFVSIHANATSGSRKKKATTRGYKVYFLSQAKNEEDKLAAMRENAVIELEEKPQNYSALQNVLIDLAGNEYLRESQELSIFLDRQFEKSLSKMVSRKDRGIGQANFWVLNGAYMPSILIETCFISNRSEERLLNNKKFQKQMAEAIYEALLSFKKKLEQDYE